MKTKPKKSENTSRKSRDRSLKRARDAVESAIACAWDHENFYVDVRMHSNINVVSIVAWSEGSTPQIIRTSLTLAQLGTCKIKLVEDEETAEIVLAAPPKSSKLDDEEKTSYEIFEEIETNCTEIVESIERDGESSYGGVAIKRLTKEMIRLARVMQYIRS